MKYYLPTVLQALLKEQQVSPPPSSCALLPIPPPPPSPPSSPLHPHSHPCLIYFVPRQGMVNEYLSLDDGSSLLPEDVAQLRNQRESIKERLDQAVNQLTPLKWVNRVIMWCADKMPSFGDTILKESSYAPVCAPNGVRTEPDP